MARQTVLLTGATGYIAAQLLPEFRGRYDLRLVDARGEDREGRPVEGVRVMDLLAAPREQVAPLFEGVDTVVHLAYIRPLGEGAQAQYDGEKLNVDLAQRVYQLAQEAGGRRVVAASTNQAAKWYEQPWFRGVRDRVGPEEYPRPDNLYGWAKAAYEPPGFVYACVALGPRLEVVLLRIVAPREIRGSDFEGAPRERYIRDLAGYVSPRDLAQLFVRSIETPDIEDEHGVPFHIFYGVSNNARKFWSITNAREVIGYAPEDDSEVRFAEDIARLLK